MFVIFVIFCSFLELSRLIYFHITKNENVLYVFSRPMAIVHVILEQIALYLAPLDISAIPSVMMDNVILLTFCVYA